MFSDCAETRRIDSDLVIYIYRHIFGVDDEHTRYFWLQNGCKNHQKVK